MLNNRGRLTTVPRIGQIIAEETFQTKAVAPTTPSASPEPATTALAAGTAGPTKMIPRPSQSPMMEAGVDCSP
jgi:hypothetical protein